MRVTASLMPRASPEHDVDGLLALSGLAQPSSDGQLSVGQPRRMLVSLTKFSANSGCPAVSSLKLFVTYMCTNGTDLYSSLHLSAQDWPVKAHNHLMWWPLRLAEQRLLAASAHPIQVAAINKSVQQAVWTLTSTSGRQLAVMSTQTARSSSLCLSAAT